MALLVLKTNPDKKRDVIKIQEIDSNSIYLITR